MIKSDSAYMSLRLIDGIYYANYKPIVVNLRIAKEIVKQRQSVTLGESYPFVVDIRYVKRFKMDHVSYFSSDESVDDISKLALIIKSKFVAKLANLYYIIVKPRIPTKLFSSEEEAKEWINLTLNN